MSTSCRAAVEEGRDFQIYVTDDRYDVRSLQLVSVKDEVAARQMAERILAAPHHHAVEVWDRDTLLFTLCGDDASKQRHRLPNVEAR